ncbi:ribonuclease D [bacterium]|nr:ribonuclease D [bacterium]
MSSPHFHYIDSQDAFDQCLQALGSAPYLAVDTEFMRSDTFFPQPALIQLSAQDDIFLIDPVAIGDMTALAVLMQNEGIVKIMHSCSEDLDVFRVLLGVLPTPVFDTQLAAAFCGLDYSMSYQRLVDAVLGKHVTKDETRSDWLQRPLSDTQKAYAADDVLWLPALYGHLQQRLDELQRGAWLQEDCSRLLVQAELSQDVSRYYLRVKAAGRASPRQLAILQALSAWRETMAREMNVPRGRVVQDSALIEIMNESPRNKSALSAIKTLRPSELRRFGDQLLTGIEQGWACADHELPATLPFMHSDKDKKRYKQIKSLVNKTAEELALPAELLGRRRDIEALIKPSAALGSALNEGWRYQLLGEHIAGLASPQG